MSQSTSHPGGAPGQVGGGRKPPGYWRLVVKLAASQRLEKQHYDQRMEHLAALRRLATLPEETPWPEARDAGQALIKAPEGAIYAPLVAFTEAIQARTREASDTRETKALTRLAVRVMEVTTALHEATKAQLDASNESARLRAEVLRLVEDHEKGSGALH